MKKLTAKLSLFLLPILLYYCLFLNFEPYNYFGIQKNNHTAQDQLIYRVRTFDAQPENALLLGDSRMAHFDLELVEKVTGRKFSTLAFGGAGQKEIIDLFWHAVQCNPNLDTVYLEVSFYTLNRNYDRDRIGNIETITQNPFAFLTNFNYHLEALNRLKMSLQGYEFGPEHESAVYTNQDYQAADGTPFPYRRQLMQYLHHIYPNFSSDPDGISLAVGETISDEDVFRLYDFLTASERADAVTYQINETHLSRLEEIAAYCQAHEIRLVFVLPPIADAVYDLIGLPLGIRDTMLPVVERLRTTGAEVRDYEWTERPNIPEYLFFDGFHIDTEYGLPDYTRLLFGEETDLWH